MEVPLLVGKSIKVAEALLTAAGLTVQTRVSDPPTAGVAPDTVITQWPSSGALVASGSRVVVTYQPRTSTATVAPYVVVIDAGHQQKPDLALEPIGPGSKVTKPKVAGGATGATTGQPEYALALSISLKIRAALVAKGVKVVMVRTTNAVDIPNSRRAQLANAEKADLFLRVHLNGNTDATVRGIEVLYPTGNVWVKNIGAASLKAAQRVQQAVLKTTGAPWQGLSGRSDQSGFNFCTRPAIMVECGYLSNADDDKLLVTPAYQQKLADGISAGVLTFLQGK
jgi:N-acetylmuramoyl-L-alanine amidase